MSQFYSPLRYPGGKNCIFPFVSKIFYENDLIGTSYAEPYAGGAGLALRLLFEEYVDRIYINDLDKSIYAFWKIVVGNADPFCHWLETVPVTIDSWLYFREIQKNVINVSTFDLAKATFFLNRTNISGVIKGGVIGGLEQKGKYKIDARFNRYDLIERIQKIACFRNRISISNIDGISFIKKVDTLKEDVFVYLDPPYFQKGADLYINFYTANDHKKLSKHVRKMQKKWMVSYDNHEFILNLYAERKRLMYKLSQSASNRIGNEIFVFSDGISFENSMSELNSAVVL